MSVFDLLTDNDKHLIQTYINLYGATNKSCQPPEPARLEEILSSWAEAKNKSLIKLFDNQLILCRPYSYEAQTEAISRDIEAAFKLDPEPQAFYRWWQNLSFREKASISIDFVEEKVTNFGCSPWIEMGTCFSSSVLAVNQYLNANCIITFLKSKTKMKVFRGMKPMKILHRFVQEFDGPEDLFDAFRIWHSRQLNQKTIDGELCLSIHPLDYMTMSDNANDWTSCMRWEDNSTDSPGDYRAGTVSDMNSPYLIVGYLHNPKHKYENDYPNFSWNSKQWRELFLVQEGIINEIKGYPFQDQYLTNACLMWIKELAEKNLGWTYENEEVNINDEIKTNKGSIMFTFQPGLHMYNDMGTLGIHRGRINSEKLFNKLFTKYNGETLHKDNQVWKTFFDIEYGGIANCMNCGRELDENNSSSENVFCNICERVCTCPNCGASIRSYDDFYYVEEFDDPICLDCWEDSCAWDDFCSDEPHLISSMTEVDVLLGYDAHDKPIWMEEHAYCYDPNNNLNFNDIFNSPIKYMKEKRNAYYYEDHYYVTLDMIREGKEQDFINIFCLPRGTDLSTLINDYI